MIQNYQKWNGKIEISGVNSEGGAFYWSRIVGTYILFIVAAFSAAKLVIG